MFQGTDVLSAQSNRGTVTASQLIEVDNDTFRPRKPMRSFPRRHPGADRWVWSYFRRLRDDAELAARAAGGSLPEDTFSFDRNSEQLQELCKSVPRLQGTDLAELQQALRDLDAALAKRPATASPRGRGDADTLPIHV